MHKVPKQQGSLRKFPWLCWMKSAYFPQPHCYITTRLQFSLTEVLRGLRDFLNTDRPEHHSTDRLKERGVQKEVANVPSLEVGTGLCLTNTGIVSRAALGKLLRDQAEHVEAHQRAAMPFGPETGNWKQRSLKSKQHCPGALLLLSLLGCSMSQQHASASEGWICFDNCMCCHTEKETADQTCYLTQSRSTHSRPINPTGM